MDKPHQRARISKCRSPDCQAPIFFVINKKTGRPAPVDAEPKVGYILTWHDPGTDGLADGHFTGELVHFYTPHHATCPDVARFRTKKES